MLSKRAIIYINSLIALTLFSISTAFATPPITNNSLSGKIVDEQKRPVEGAIVEIPDLKAGAATDSNGVYHINDLPKGHFLVSVKLLSYATITRNVVINGHTHQNFTMHSSAIEGQEVVITGQSKATEMRLSPIPVVAVNHTYLQENLGTNVIDAIARIPGVTAVTTGPNVSKPFIRGLGYNRILTLYDGMRQEGQQWGDEHGIEVDQYSIDHVEVIKGPASLIYGSDALAGVVNLIPTPPAPEGKIQGNVLGEYQGNNNMLGGSAMLSGNNKGFYWLGRVSHKQAKDYQDKYDGRVYATNYNETDATANFGLNRSWGYSHLDLTLFDDQQAIPEGTRDSVTRQFTKQTDTGYAIVPQSELNTYTLPALHQRVQYYRAFLTNNFNIGNNSLAVNLGFARSVRREFSHPEDPSLAGLYLKLNTYTYDVKYFINQFHGWDISAGVNGMYQDNNVTSGTEFIIPSYHQFDLGPFATIKRTFGKLDVNGGVRYDTRTFHNDALYSVTDSIGIDHIADAATPGAENPFKSYSNTFSGFTYSLGLTYSFSPRLSMKANIARGFRSPNIAEISANGVHPGANIYQLGNPDFKPEFSLQEDIGLDYVSKHISASISVFNNDITNYIYNQRVLNSQGLDSVIVPGNQTFQYQAGKARLYGGEISLDIHPHPLDWLHFENSLSVVYGLNEGNINNDSEKYLPFMPPVHGTSELRASFKHPFKHLANSFAKVQVAYYAAQNRVFLAYNTETPTPGYTLLNVALGTDIQGRKGNTLFNISLFANNLFNTAYQDHLSRLKYMEEYPNDPRGHLGIYNMGRNIGIKLLIPLDIR